MGFNSGFKGLRISGISQVLLWASDGGSTQFLTVNVFVKTVFEYELM